ncbi:hypothetical protein PENSPDRAFT_395702 [Peniophora sp. CONT]|nr:hypothetical protein PENSPDRAFT_395702 [Peniophora sp. CONT]
MAGYHLGKDPRPIQQASALCLSWGFHLGSPTRAAQNTIPRTPSGVGPTTALSQRKAARRDPSAHEYHGVAWSAPSHSLSSLKCGDSSHSNMEGRKLDQTRGRLENVKS